MAQFVFVHTKSSITCCKNGCFKHFPMTFFWYSILSWEVSSWRVKPTCQTNVKIIWSILYTPLKAVGIDPCNATTKIYRWTHDMVINENRFRKVFSWLLCTLQWSIFLSPNIWFEPCNNFYSKCNLSWTLICHLGVLVKKHQLSNHKCWRK